MILCCGRYCDGNRLGRHGNAAGSFGVSNSQTYGRVRTKAPHLRFRRATRKLMPLLTRGGRRSKGAKGNQRKRGVRDQRMRERERGQEREKRVRDTCGRERESRSRWKEWRR